MSQSPFIYIIDNYDSFTYNLVHSVQRLGARVEVGLNDQITSSEILNDQVDGVIISPGPGKPKESGRLPELVDQLYLELPILGVCLGHQMIAEYFGGRLVQAKRIVHGKSSTIEHDEAGVFKGLGSPLQVGRYHSLAVDEQSLPSCLIVTARSEDGEIMGLRHDELSIETVQFHPESILTPLGDSMIKNFIEQAAARTSRRHINRLETCEYS